MAASTLPPIPQEWMKGYIDELLKFANDCGPNSVMGQSALLRADNAMDIVKAWRESHAGGWRVSNGG